MGKNSASLALKALSGVSMLVLASQSAVAAQAAPAPTEGPAETSPAADQPQTAEEAMAQRDIVVTATKRLGATIQNVPLAITAFDAEALAAKEFRGLYSIAYASPNVQINPQGAFPGTANISIRGLNVASSVPSTDPAVGVFLDGIYMGINQGVLFALFDVDSIEVLRGPQGVLFGKNVTGGAMLVNSARPTKEFSANGMVSVETGPNYTGTGAVSGPLIDDVLQIRIAGYANYDKGWYTNYVTDSNFGGRRTFIGRASLLFTPGDAVELLARYEHGKNQEFGGVPTRNRRIFPDNDGHKVGASAGRKFREGTLKDGGPSKWDFLTLEGNFDVGLGDGKITTITGYRDFQQINRSDVDGRPELIFHTESFVGQNQFSQELRYAGTFGNVDLTTGVYYFYQNLKSLEFRQTAAASRIIGGGVQKTDTYSAFAATDLHVSDEFTINLGARYNIEKKRARITTARAFIPPAAGICNFVARTCTPEFIDDATFKSFIPKIGFQWQPERRTQVYGFYTRGFRSGGYNLRNSIVGASPGPYNDEKQDAVELGLKTDIADGRIRLNAAVFQYKLAGAQRTVNIAVPVVGLVQLLRNSADETIRGGEIEASANVTDELVLRGSIGLTNGRYTRVLADLNNDRVLNDIDLGLKIPLLTPTTYSFGFAYARDVGFGLFRASADYAYADPTVACDANVNCAFSSVKQLDASTSVSFMEDRLTASLYGRNLLNDEIQTTNAGLGAIGTLTGLARGRVIGASLRFRY